MHKKLPNIALLSPNQNAYSETFIQAHKKRLKGNIFYYYSGEVPTAVEGGVVINSRRRRIVDLIKGHFHLNRFSLAEQAVITSFKKNKIDLVFAEYGVTGERILPVCRELGLPLIVHFHGFDASQKDVIEEYKKYQRLFSYASFVVAVSKKMYQDLLEMGCPKYKLIYTVCGPDDQFFEVEPTFEKQQFVAIGRFVDKKAPYYLILSFLKVLERFPDSRLVVAGEGELFNTCKNLVKHFGIEDKIELPGVIQPAVFRRYLRESLAFVQHSVTAENGDSEGTPVSVLEASAAGLPVLATSHAGIPDVVIDGETGLLVAEHDVKGMAENMITLLENPSLAKKLGKNAKEHMRRNYTLSRHINVLNELTEKALQESRQPTP